MELFTVCPHHAGVFAGAAEPDAPYASVLAAHGAASEKLGAAAMLIYDFSQSLDPWITAQLLLSVTGTLEPIVAVNPALAHPARTARALAGLNHLYGRRVDLNVVAGAKEAELAALGRAPQPDKYAHMAEFVSALRAVLAGEPFRGEYHRLDAVSIAPPADPALAPRVIVPASSSPGFAAVAPHLDRALVMAAPRDAIDAQHRRLADGGLTGGLAMIVGIVARRTGPEAWAVARERYSGDRRTRLAARAFDRQVTSTQHRANLDAAAGPERRDECLWYGADGIGMDCPKLVGSYAQVAEALGAYTALGVRTVVLDLPHDLAEYEHINSALDRAAAPRGPAGRSEPAGAPAGKGGTT